MILISMNNDTIHDKHLRLIFETKLFSSDPFRHQYSSPHAIAGGNRGNLPTIEIPHMFQLSFESIVACLYIIVLIIGGITKRDSNLSPYHSHPSTVNTKDSVLIKILWQTLNHEIDIKLDSKRMRWEIIHQNFSSLGFAVSEELGDKLNDILLLQRIDSIID